MPLITKLHTYTDDDPIIYSDLNANWDALYDLINGNLDNTNIATGAAIDPTKISGTAVTLTTPQTILNKTLVKPIQNTVLPETIDVFASTITFDMTTSNLHNVQLTGNATLAVANVSGGVVGGNNQAQPFVIILQQDGTGSRTVSWWSGIKWVTGSAPVLSTAANVYDIFAFIYDGVNYYGSIVGQAYA